MKRIAIDMDEVMADYFTSNLQLFNSHFNKSLTKEDLQGKRITDIYPELAAELHEITNQAGFFRNLEVIKGARETILELSKHFEIMIATAAKDVPNSLHAKYEWLKEHFDFLDEQYFLFCGDKSVVQADYLIDDNISQLNSFTNQGILFTSHHNIYVDWNIRCNNWLEVKNYFMKELAMA